MRKYVAKHKGMYVNYISLFSNPLRLGDTSIVITACGKIKKGNQRHLIYSSREACILKQINKDFKIILIEE
jgi:hypothetical protein